MEGWLGEVVPLPSAACMVRASQLQAGGPHGDQDTGTWLWIVGTDFQEHQIHPI